MTGKINVAILGSGNIGTDLLYKLLRSEKLNPTVMIGVDPKSQGLALAKEYGLDVVDNGIEGFEQNPDRADIIFDATSAKAHMHHAEVARKLGKKIIDLTPAAVGPFCVPAVNMDEQMIRENDNVNMVTCGGQATVPIMKAITRVANVEYGEIVSSVSSKSAGPGTRQNIDEFIKTTALALEVVGGAKKGKVIIVINPADPPIMMRNSIFAKLESDQFDEQKIIQSIDEMVESLQSYVPGFRLLSKPEIKEGIVKVFIEVEGLGDFLPKYAGNLDIITSAAVKTGEVMAEQLLGKGM